MRDFSYFTSTWDDRVDICNKYEKLFEKKFNATNLQNVKTPRFIINKMIDKVSVLENKKILVMFNFEFIDALIYEYNVKPEMIYFVADCHSEMCKVIKLVYNLPINNIVYHDEFKDGSLTNILRKMSMKFDLCITNPPYNNGLDLKILDNVKDICDEIVCIHPGGWLLDIKGDTTLYNKLRNNLIVNDLEFFNGNPIFNIQCNHPIVITHIDKNKKDDIIRVNWFTEEFETNDINNVTKFSKDWLTIVKRFYLKIKEISEKDNITNYNKSFEELINKEHVVQISRFGGHNDFNSDRMIKDDFYTMVMRGNENLGVRTVKPNKIYFEFKTSYEQLNFLNYLKTDFSRFCLCFYKNSVELISGRICRLIPWLDFTQEWDDEKLFKHFEIDKQTQDYIRKFLPDYYGIRKEKTPEDIIKETIKKYYLNNGNGNIFVNLYNEQTNNNIHNIEIKVGNKNYKFSFEESIYAQNFLKYINNSKFIKLLIKINPDKENILSLIPDMDFNEEWTDEKLIEYFKLDQKIIEYIKNK